jgi:hypothetical protein
MFPLMRGKVDRSRNVPQQPMVVPYFVISIKIRTNKNIQLIYGKISNPLCYSAPQHYLYPIALGYFLTVINWRTYIRAF